MRRSKVNWLEIVGLLPSSLILGPMLGYGLLGMVFVLGSWVVHRSQPGGIGERFFWGIAFLPALMISGLPGLVGAWTTVLLGADHLRQRARRRWAAVVCLVLGIIAAGYWLVWMGISSRSVTHFGALGWLYWTVLLVVPMTVGARQLYLLLGSSPLLQGGGE